MKIVIGKNSKAPLTVNQLGYGTMRLTGPQIWGEPTDRAQALQVLKTAVANGVNFLDTADYYGKDVPNRLIREALYPYPEDLVICTKVGCARGEDKSWFSYATPQNIRDSIDKNLHTLKLEQLSLVHFRLILPCSVPFEESLDALFQLQQEGKILHVGLSNISPEELQLGLKRGTIATVENAYGYANRFTSTGPAGITRGGQEVLAICEQNEIPLIPYFPLVNSLAHKNEKIAKIAEKYHATHAQINLAWLLHVSDWILPIPGTSKLIHLQENLQSSSIQLTKQEMIYLN